MLTPSPNGARWPEPQPLANPGRFTVAAAALAHRARLAPHVPIWDLVAAVPRWRLLPLPGD
jgi:hypothetical protein